MIWLLKRPTFRFLSDVPNTTDRAPLSGRCSKSDKHGATIGQLNPESIFYLRSRGIDTGMARQMLIHAFAGEIIERIQCEPARAVIDKLVWDRLEANPHMA